jgi:DNA primase
MTMMTSEERKQLRAHANRNIIHVLNALGFEYRANENLFQACCPCTQHGGDGNNRTAFSWRSDIGYWRCWTHHCNELYGDDIFGLIRSIRDCSFGQAVRWLKTTLASASIDTTVKIATKETKSGGKLHVHQPLAEHNLRFLTPPTYLHERGFDPEVLKSYNVGLWSRLGTYMHDRVVFPIRDHEDHLIGYTGRTIHPRSYFEERGLEYAKWVHGRSYHRFQRDDSLLTGSILFNLYRAKTFMLPDRKLILVEGPLDGMKLEMAGIHNWVASLSTQFGPAHRTLLVKYGVSHLYVAFDNETRVKPDKPTAGEKGWEMVQNTVGTLFNLERIMLPLDKDPGDLPVDQLQDIFAEAIVR